MPQLVILSGSPGSGKSTIAKTKYPNHHLCDKDLGTQRDYRTTNQDCVLTACAPTKRQKSYWIKQAIVHGFTPTLLVIWVPRMTAYNRMLGRSGVSKDQMNNKQQGVEQWYKLYKAHPQEQRLLNE